MPCRWKVLIADDGAEERRYLADLLKRVDEFVVTEAETAGEVMAMSEAGDFDLVVLGAALREMEGRDVCRLLRHRGIRATIVLLLTSESDAEVILALDAGANDCMSTPVRPGVFLARLRAHLRQYARRDAAEFPIRGYVFRPASKVLVDTIRQRRIRLTEKEVVLLKYLYHAREAGASREQLLRNVWGYSPDVATHTVETHVWRLRRKIECDPRNAGMLVNEGGRYRLRTDSDVTPFDPKPVNEPGVPAVR